MRDFAFRSRKADELSLARAKRSQLSLCSPRDRLEAEDAEPKIFQDTSDNDRKAYLTVFERKTSETLL